MPTSSTAYDADIALEKYSACTILVSYKAYWPRYWPGSALETNAPRMHSRQVRKQSPPAFTPKCKRQVPIIPYFNDLTRNERGGALY
jgi:hypothetical protein